MRIDYKLLLRIISLVLQALMDLPAAADHRNLASSADELIKIVSNRIPSYLTDSTPDPPAN